MWMLRRYKPPFMSPSCPDTYRECIMLKCFSAPCYHTLLYYCHVRVISYFFLTSGIIPFGSFRTCPVESRICQRTVSLWWGPGHGLLGQALLHGTPSPAVAEGASILAAYLCNLLYRSEEQLERVIWKSKMSLDYFWYADVAKEIGRIYINSLSSQLELIFFLKVN